MILLRTEETDIEASACEIKSWAWVDGYPHERWHRRIYLDNAHKVLSCMLLCVVQNGMCARLKKEEARCTGQVHDPKPGNVEMVENPGGAGIYAYDSR